MNEIKSRDCTLILMLNIMEDTEDEALIKNLFGVKEGANISPASRSLKKSGLAFVFIMSKLSA